MKPSSLAAVVFATTTLGSGAALAQNIGASPQVLDLSSGSNFFGDTFATANAGASFADQFSFSVPASASWSLNAVVSSISGTFNSGLDITGLALYGAGGNLVSSGASLSSGVLDVWTIAGAGLAAGDYYLQVSGSVVSDGAASFGGAATAVAAPVPEPAAYALLLGGLGALGVLGRRRKASGQS